eukprot:3888802-Prymnesium_polylepis.3
MLMLGVERRSVAVGDQVHIAVGADNDGRPNELENSLRRHVKRKQSVRRCRSDLSTQLRNCGHCGEADRARDERGHRRWWRSERRGWGPCRLRWWAGKGHTFCRHLAACHVCARSRARTDEQKNPLRGVYRRPASTAREAHPLGARPDIKIVGIVLAGHRRGIAHHFRRIRGASADHRVGNVCGVRHVQCHEPSKVARQTLQVERHLLAAHNLVARRYVSVIDVQVLQRCSRTKQAERCRLDRRVAPAMTIHSAAGVNCAQEAPDARLGPPADARDEQ